MIDPILSLALSFSSNKGTYALLLGSGISRPAGIPTGWEVTLELITKLASISGEKMETNPEEWFVKKFEKDINYSDLLSEIAKTSTERSSLLKQYFEPTEEEREQKLKTPTKAHTAIAKLVKEGFVRVIITTNFDRLLEIALEKENVVPDVISTIDSIEGAYPIIHSKCTVIKVNGDYLDTRIRNTLKELEKYDEKMNELLDRVLDEFGLIVCGWSAEWDIALRLAIERCKNRRFSTYWAIKENVSKTAKKLIQQRGAVVIKNVTADMLFSELLEKCNALVESEKLHPVSVKLAIATAKKYLSEEKYLISLHDLILAESKRIILEFSQTNLPIPNGFSKDEFLKRVGNYESKSEILINLFITICYWGNSVHTDLIRKSLESIINSNPFEGGLVVYVKLRKYPSLLLAYSGGIAALANDKYGFIKSILIDTNVKYESKPKSFIKSVTPYSVMDKSVAAMLPDRNERNYTPFNDYLAYLLQPYFSDIVVDQNSFNDLFDKFEYVKALIYAGYFGEKGTNFWAPVGSFGWRKKDPEDSHISKLFEKELENRGNEHPILQIGLFDSSLEKVMEVKKELDKFIFSLHWGF